MKAMNSFQCIVVKIGSALLVDRETGCLKTDWLAALIDDIAWLRAQGKDVIIVSSGSIALGRSSLSTTRPDLRLEESQAAASIGQIALSRSYSEQLDRHGIVAAQILLTLGDTEERRRYLNARSTLTTLLKHGALPIINENDTVATSEIRYGDNDRLAARVAAMISADLLVLLSDIDGLYSEPPENPGARFICEVDKITSDIEAMAGGAGSRFSKGGMRTKIDAAKIAVSAGSAMVITDGGKLNPLRALENGARATWFAASASPAAARKQWIAGHLDLEGALTIDQGAAKALGEGRSLLPAGVVRVDGNFSRGDAVLVKDEASNSLARGLIAYDAEDARQLIGRKSADIPEILGFEGRSEMIHRDDLVILDDL